LLVSALILAGGKATRLGGIAKHEIVVDGETIFARQVKLLAPRVAEILVAGPAIEGYRNVRDRIDGAGPLAGIAAGLAASRTPWLLVMAGDMPHVTSQLVEDLLAAANDSLDAVDEMGSGTTSPLPSDGLDAVGVRVNGLPEPLLSVLHVRVLPVIERALAADPEAVRNLNSPEDLGATRGSK
jgi:molybdopterin-guanine dinucleotide biosynthesis protein A